MTLPYNKSQDGSSHPVKQFQYMEWPEEGVPEPSITGRFIYWDNHYTLVDESKYRAFLYYQQVTVFMSHKQTKVIFTCTIYDI